MGNVLQNCPPSGVLFSSINLSNPAGTCQEIIKYIAVGGINNTTAIESQQHKYATSSDGITWNGKGRGVFQYYAYSVAIGKDNLGNNLWVSVGVGVNDTIASSINGTQWTARGRAFSNYGLKVKFGRDETNKFLWVAVGNGTHSITTSTNGTQWTGRGNTIFNAGYGVEYDKLNSLWVAVGESLASQPFNSKFSIATSTNGTQWTGSLQINTINIGYDVAFGKNAYGLPLWVVVGRKGLFGTTCAYANDSSASSWWSFKLFNSYGSGVAYNGSNLWVAVGDNGYATSSNGQTWTSYTNTLVNYSKIIYGDNLWIAVNENNTTNTNSIATSTNATEWTFRNSNILATRGIMYNFLPPVVSQQFTLSVKNGRVNRDNNTIFSSSDSIQKFLPPPSYNFFNSTFGEPIRKIGIVFKNNTNTTDSSYFDDNYKYSSLNYLTSKYYLSIVFSFTYGSSVMTTHYQFGNNIIASNNTESIISINKIITDNFTSVNPQFIKDITYSFYLTINNNDTPIDDIYNVDVNYYLTMNFYL